MPESINAPMDEFSAHMERAMDLLRQGDAAGATLAAQRAGEVRPETADVQHLLGQIAAQQQQYEDALQHYREAIDLDESFVEAMLNAAEIYLDVFRDPTSALELLAMADEWIDGDEERADWALMKADVYIEMGKTDDAKALLRAVGDLADPLLQLEKARVSYEVAEWDSAVTMLQALTDKVEALAIARRAIPSDKAIEPIELRSADIWYYLGQCYKQLKRPNEATSAFVRSRIWEKELSDRMKEPWFTDSPGDFQSKVHQAISQLPADKRAYLTDALIMIADQPGLEVIASDGVDPRSELLVDWSMAKTGVVDRLFVYQRNVEVSALGMTVGEFLVEALTEQLTPDDKSEDKSQDKVDDKTNLGQSLVDES